MQTILGAGGIIGKELAKALTAYTTHIKLVRRNPQKVNETDIIFKADLMNPPEVNEAVKGSEIVYLTAGLTYSIKVWQKSWPVIMKNVIDACVEHHAKLVFFDNIYLYDGSILNPITEGLPVNPPSKKGKVRAEIAGMIWAAVKERELQALIARAADFYGPSIKGTSVLIETVFNPLSRGKTATLMASDRFKHSYTHTRDAGRATALLGNTPAAYGQSWHLPTAPDPFTQKEWVEVVAKEFGVKPKYRVVGKGMLYILGLFVPVMGEMVEMLYQYDRDYVFNSDKFEKHFDMKPTPYLEGVREIAESMRKV